MNAEARKELAKVRKEIAEFRKKVSQFGKDVAEHSRKIDALETAVREPYQHPGNRDGS